MTSQKTAAKETTVAQGTMLSCILNRASVTRVFLVFFRQQPETTFERCSSDFRIPRTHDVDGNFLCRRAQGTMLSSVRVRP